MKRVGLGIVGGGFIARTHIDAFRRAALLCSDIPVRVELVAVADATPELATRFAAAAGGAHVCSNWQELVSRPDVDLVDICAPNHLHSRVAIGALDAGKSVYCEKPMAVTVAEAQEMAAASKRSHGQTFLAFNNLFAPSTQLAKALIDRGEIGDPVQFIGTFDQGFYSDPDLPHSWRVSRSMAGSGALGDLGSHVVSIAQHLMGPVDSVVAQDAVVFRDRPVPTRGSGYAATADHAAERRAVENDDFVSALMTFQSGAHGTIGASRVAAGRIFGIAYELRGTTGTIAVENERPNELKIFRMADPPEDRGFKTILAGSQVDGFREAFFGFDYGGGGTGYFDTRLLEVRGILRALEGTAPYPFDFAFGLENQRTVDAIANSARLGGARITVARA